jgi:hypothetical protein
MPDLINPIPCPLHFVILCTRTGLDRALLIVIEKKEDFLKYTKCTTYTNYLLAKKKEYSRNQIETERLWLRYKIHHLDVGRWTFAISHRSVFSTREE